MTSQPPPTSPSTTPTAATAPRQPHPLDWRPYPGPQTDFLSRTTDELLYGGAAGGGKSESILVDSIRYVGRGYGKAYTAIIFRRTFPELQKSLIPRAWDFYPRLGGRYNEQLKRWRFPGGETVLFGHLEHASAVHEHQSTEYQFIGFDELTTFTEEQYLYLFSRLRSSRGVPLRMRAGTNPGGPGHAWVFARWAAWLDPLAKLAEPGQTLHFLRNPDGTERVVPASTPFAKGRTFIPARLEDNPSLAADGKYEANLQMLDPVTRERLRYGNWLVQGERYLFNGVRRYEALPPGCRYAIGYDLATTAKTSSDYCAAVVLAEEGGVFYVVDVRREHADVPTFARVLKQLADTYPGAPLLWYASTTEVGTADLLRETSGLRSLRAELAKVGKYERALPCAAAWNDVPAMGRLPARDGRVFVPHGAPWLQKFLAEVTTFDGLERAHDDQVDALAAAFDLLDHTKGAAVPRTSPTKFEKGKGGLGKFQW